MPAEVEVMILGLGFFMLMWVPRDKAADLKVRTTLGGLEGPHYTWRTSKGPLPHTETRSAVTRVRRTDKMIKKDQHTTRDDRREVEEEIRSSGTKPEIRNPNRDRARGDWDRSKGGT